MYGFNITLSQQIRDGTGNLKANDTNNLLPIKKTVASVTGLKGVNAIAAGDPRVNVHPRLLSVQTIFFREHNRIAQDIRLS